MRAVLPSLLVSVSALQHVIQEVASLSSQMIQGTRGLDS